jgi:hypothetical protein
MKMLYTRLSFLKIVSLLAILDVEAEMNFIWTYCFS